MDGISTRFAFKVLAATFNHDTHGSRRRSGASDVRARAGDPARAVRPRTSRSASSSSSRRDLAPRYAEFIGHEIQKAYLESYHDYGQNLFDRYVDYADAWIEDQDFKDPDTGQMLDRELLNQELTKIEKPAGIANPKDFRNEVVKFALRSRAANGGKNPPWTSYEKIREVIERRMFSQVEDLLAGHQLRLEEGHRDGEEARGLRERMMARGYTERQVRRLVEWYMRVKQSA